MFHFFITGLPYSFQFQSHRKTFLSFFLFPSSFTLSFKLVLFSHFFNEQNSSWFEELVKWKEKNRANCWWHWITSENIFGGNALFSPSFSNFCHVRESDFYIRNSNRSFPKIYRTCEAYFARRVLQGNKLQRKWKLLEIHLQWCEEYKRNSNSLHFDLTIKRIKIDRNISSRIS